MPKWLRFTAFRKARRAAPHVEALDARTLMTGLSPLLGVEAPAARAARAGSVIAVRGMASSPSRDGRPAPETIRESRALFQAVPLPDLGSGRYRGQQGGLYPGGSNQRPESHEQAGLDHAALVQPLNRNGQPAIDGKIVMLSIGMSNTSIEFEAFQRLAKNDSAIDPDLILVNGAQNGASIDRIVSGPSQALSYFRTIEARLSRAGVTAKQVQVVWIKQADANPRGPFPQSARKLENELVLLTRLLKDRYPNLQLAYLSSRIYGGYARTRLNPEPFAFESGFAVKRLIERQIDGDPLLNQDSARGPVDAPWLAWGPYLWANGPRPRSDGLSYERSDFAADGTHPSPRGARKVASQLLAFFKNDSTTRTWFLAA